MDTGAHAVSSAKLRHPDKHDNRQFLRPGKAELEQPILKAGNIQTGQIPVNDRKKNDGSRQAHKGGNNKFFQTIKKFHRKLLTNRPEGRFEHSRESSGH